MRVVEEVDDGERMAMVQFFTPPHIGIVPQINSPPKAYQCDNRFGP